MTDQNNKRILIVGGVAGGASAAARARRLSESAEIIIFERGPYISFANCGLAYHIGGDIAERDRLLIQTPEGFKNRYNIDVKINTEVIAIDKDNRTITVKDLTNNTERTEKYDKLILSPGAEPIVPPIEGVDLPGVYTLRSIPDMDAIKKIVDKNSSSSSSSLIIGGGYIGLEMAEALRQRGVDVTLVELSPQVLGPLDPEMATPLHQELILQGVDLKLKTSVTAIKQAGNGLAVTLSTKETVNTDMVILAIGVKPETKLVKDAGLSIGARGGIAVNEKMQTSDADIYAVGDAVEVKFFPTQLESLIPLAGPANRQGRIAADNIFGKDSKYSGTQGTAVCKIFNLTAAMTGLNEKLAQHISTAYEKIYIHPASHATYYPGAAQMSIKLLFDPDDGKILGAQAIGTKGVDKRIDVIATALRAGLTVYDLQEMELCYAPPYGSAKDPVNYAGFVAANILRGDMGVCHSEEMLAPKDDQILLDVRTPAEVSAGTIPNSINIPIDDLRSRLNELDKTKEHLVFCQVGLRGYLACRILAQNEFKCRNLTGGYKTFKYHEGIMSNCEPFSREPKDDAGETETACPTAAAPVKHIDACGLQCPGPIMKLKTELDKLEIGTAVTITTTDPAFGADIQGFCTSTGDRLADLKSENGHYTATIVKGAGATTAVKQGGLKGKTIVVFSNDFDKAMAAFIIANGAAAMGSKVTLFFTFWGLNLLRRAEAAQVKKNIVEKMFGMMMPRGAGKTKLSKMHMAGMGTKMMQGIMKSKNVSSLTELIENARDAGVNMVACTMSMDLMGIKEEELIDGVQKGGVAMYLAKAETADTNLFI
jgi:NADPH-dependent 2,4-dienoyl-CoA reductase/sulfur reductase-like enzyme/peroxiredoxin family protein/rhodanese-related sulfurtransferase/TusA-related sulfurtransferase